MNRFEEFANQINDSDLQWWPFLHLRPPKSAPITTFRVALLSALYGALIGTFLLVLSALVGGPLAELHPAEIPFGTMLVLFVAHRSTLAVAWNRRAARLALSRSLQPRR